MKTISFAECIEDVQNLEQFKERAVITGLLKRGSYLDGDVIINSIYNDYGIKFTNVKIKVHMGNGKKYNVSFKAVRVSLLDVKMDTSIADVWDIVKRNYELSSTIYSDGHNVEILPTSHDFRAIYDFNTSNGIWEKEDFEKVVAELKKYVKDIIEKEEKSALLQYKNNTIPDSVVMESMKGIFEKYVYNEAGLAFAERESFCFI